MTEYIPSPELVEAGVDAYLDADFPGWREDDYDQDAAREPERVPMRTALTAAVAYRTPSGDPELIPWAEVATLIDLLREVCDAYEWTLNHPDNVVGNALHLPLIDARAALAPWTQENR